MKIFQILNGENLMHIRKLLPQLSLCLLILLSPSWVMAFSFSGVEEEEQQARKVAAKKFRQRTAIPKSCSDELKKQKIAVIIGETHVSGRIRPILMSNYGLHFQIINKRLRKLGLKTYTQEEITAQIVQEEMTAALNNDPDAALSATERLGANFILRGVIRSRSQINPIVNAHEVFVNMSFTLSDASGQTVADASAGGDSWSGADTLSISLDIVREKAYGVVRKLYSQYCKHKGHK